MEVYNTKLLTQTSQTIKPKHKASLQREKTRRSRRMNYNQFRSNKYLQTNFRNINRKTIETKANRFNQKEDECFYRRHV